MASSVVVVTNSSSFELLRCQTAVLVVVRIAMAEPPKKKRLLQTTLTGLTVHPRAIHKDATGSLYCRFVEAFNRRYGGDGFADRTSILARRTNGEL